MYIPVLEQNLTLSNQPCMEIASKQNPPEIVSLLSTNLQNVKHNNTKTFANYNLYTYEYMSENNFLILYSNIKNQSMSCYRP